MKAQVIQIGNSKGIRIPKVLLEESGIRDDVELEVCPEGILVRNVRSPRRGWDGIFRAMADQDEDHPTSSDLTSFDSKDWQW